jgi:hypothetical protein
MKGNTGTAAATASITGVGRDSTASASKSCAIQTPSPAPSRCTAEPLQLDLTGSSIQSQDLHRGQQGLVQSRSAHSSQPAHCNACASPAYTPKCDVNVGTLMRPETGAWANRTSVFCLPVKPLGLQKLQAPLVSATQDSARIALRSNRLLNLRKAQALVFGVHDIPFTSASAVAAEPAIQSPKGRRYFPMSGQCSLRDCLSKSGRSPVPTVQPSDVASDRPCPAAASFLYPEGHISESAADISQVPMSPPDSSRRRHTPNKKDRNCSGGSIRVDLALSRMFLSE